VDEDFGLPAARRERQRDPLLLRRIGKGDDEARRRALPPVRVNDWNAVAHGAGVIGLGNERVHFEALARFLAAARDPAEQFAPKAARTE
jgi:hypothetical protein